MKRSDVEQVLLKIGVPASILGFAYISDTILMLDGCGEVKPNMTVIYQVVGKGRNTTGSRVERAIRHAFEVARKSGDVQTVEHYIGFTHKENSSSLYQMLLTIKQELN